MNWIAATLFLFIALASLFWVRQFRQEKQAPAPPAPVVSVETSNDQEEQAQPSYADSFFLEVGLARRGPRPIRVTLLNDSGKELSAIRFSGKKKEIRYVDQVTKYRVFSPGHLPVVRPWPQSADLQKVTLVAQGEDEEFYLQNPDVPSIQNSFDCVLRFNDSESNKLLFGVEVFLDEKLVAISGVDGKVSLPFKNIKAAKKLRVQLDNYYQEDFLLTSGLIDELQVEPLRLKKK